MNKLEKNLRNTRYLTTLAMFAVIIVVLQVLATFIRFGTFPITLTLVPIIVAGALYGVRCGAAMGTVFGVIVLIMVITGADPSGQAMLGIHPMVTSLTCILKGTACGAAAAAVYKLLSKKHKMAPVFAAAVVCPIVNTGCLYIALILFFETSLAAMFSAFMSVNFLIELVINVLLAPVVFRIVEIRSKNI